jgi:hypothetical protein
MNESTYQFRQRYRAAISKKYNAYFHAGFVFGVGLAFVVYQIMQLTMMPVWQLFALPVGWVIFNFAIYFIHRELGHVKRSWAKLFYQRHSGDHHTFFTDEDYCFEELKDFRVILFPPLLIIAVCILAGVMVLISPDALLNMARLLAVSMVSGYLLYEFFHACHHLPDHYPITQWPWFKQMREWHRVHHHKDFKHCNMNLVIPLADYIMRSQADGVQSD